MTGMTSRIIHSGRFPERRKASDHLETLGELELLLLRVLVLIFSRRSRARSVDVHPREKLLDRLRAHPGGELVGNWSCSSR